ncbi:hypothetical protein BDV33DRAFT_175799 [Aspergillus novoparasiticus]|uniref:Uncharacterized protein n=1 Tax=Aspergillus novoparasiticus TaxID=986946 RepID=A0A5N6EKS3_9EURO|nr:hypothetical protein BDV33DRAFT_175799 [Aspergillus novoparasiticus]
MYKVDDVADIKRISGDLLMILVSTDRMKDHYRTLQVHSDHGVSQWQCFKESNKCTNVNLLIFILSALF